MTDKNNPLLKDIPHTIYRNEVLSAADLLQTVHLFRIDVLPCYQEPAIVKVVSAEELKKADKFIRIEDKRVYLVSRYMLRCLLARYIPQSPEKIQFSSMGNGKPILQKENIHFNVSHTKKYVLIGLCASVLGVDMEYTDHHFDYLTVMDHCFNDQEKVYILDSSTPLANFYTLWTRKEALLKATGEGLTDQLNQVSCLDTLQNRKGYLLKTESFLSGEDHVISVSADPSIQQTRFWHLNTFPTFF
ncbi:4'-phosphopantetheinyl transferase family protein [Pedobacter sp. AW31-3R]|uniref:4'-phosphopantetheinyl transferase family protein n=1 Tax=Pedobacter sp. AW31-3R TaxID=3445781 RepID=UPI003FA14C56